MEILRTDRLYLREMNEGDAENLYLLNLDPDVIRYTGDAAFAGVEDAAAFLRNYDHYSRYGFGRWAVIEKANSEFLGWCGIKYSEDLAEYDIGFRFFKKYWNNGYATEAAKACIEFAFGNLRIHEIVGRAMAENNASIKVLENIGLSYSHNLDLHGGEAVIYKIRA